MPFSAIAALCNDNGFSNAGTIPWKVQEDLLFFRRQTLHNVIVMGRKTFESLPNGALENRVNIVLTSNKIDGAFEITADNCYEAKEIKGNLIVAHSIDAVVPWLAINFPKKRWYVIGGLEIFYAFAEKNLLNEIIITEIKEDHICDQHLDVDRIALSAYTASAPKELSGVASVIFYERRNHEETQVLQELIKLRTKPPMPNRTPYKRLADFGKSFTFDMRANTFPLFTYRKTWLRGVFEEMMLYLRGESDSKILEKRGVNIWRGNTTREFLDKCGLQHLPVGDMGPSYGFNFRHYGAEYKTCLDNYDGEGTDQLTGCLTELKRDINSTRALIMLFDPSKISQAPLPPCVYSYQFVHDEGKLSLVMTQRSSDCVLAGGWNVCGGAILLRLFCAQLNMPPGKLYWNIANMHLYENALDAICDLNADGVHPFPHLYIRQRRDDITTYKFEDLVLAGYKHGAHIELEMVA